MLKPMIAASTGSASFALMLVWSFYAPPQMILVGWSILFGLVSCFFAGWFLLEHERGRIEAVARIAAEAALEHTGLNSVT